jgi:hypothetical protein
MKHTIYILLIIAVACNNTTTTGIEAAQAATSVSNPDNCSNSLWFRKGATIHTSSYDGQGNEIAKQVSTVTKVFAQGNLTISELEIKSTDQHGANTIVSNASYRCDGKLFYMDISGLLPGGKAAGDIETSGLRLPFAVSVGDTLPDADYTIVMRSEGNTHKIKSYIKERKVESKEVVNTPAGSFECFKISSVIETETNMPGLDEKRKKAVEEMKKKMGKNKMTFWYSPDVTIVKMEFRMGEKLVSRSEITAIKK